MKTDFNITEEELESIESFLAGHLSHSDAENFRKRLEKDPEWADKVNLIRLTLLGIREASLTTTLKDIPLGEDQARLVPLKHRRRKKIILFAAVAAALIVLIISITMTGVFSNKSQKLFSQFYEPDTGLITSMGVTETYEFDIAMIDYKSGNYRKAIAKWSAIRKGHENNDTLNYFIGSSYLALKDVRPAISYFQKVLTNPGGAFFYDANWYLGLALISQGKEKEAVRYISASKNHSKEKLMKDLGH